MNRILYFYWNRHSSKDHFFLFLKGIIVRYRTIKPNTVKIFNIPFHAGIIGIADHERILALSETAKSLSVLVDEASGTFPSF